MPLCSKRSEQAGAVKGGHCAGIVCRVWGVLQEGGIWSTACPCGRHAQVNIILFYIYCMVSTVWMDVPNVKVNYSNINSLRIIYSMAYWINIRASVSLLSNFQTWIHANYLIVLLILMWTLKNICSLHFPHVLLWQPAASKLSTNPSLRQVKHKSSAC